MKVVLFFLAGGWRGNRDFYWFLGLVGIMCAICWGCFAVSPEESWSHGLLVLFSVGVCLVGFLASTRPDWYEVITDDKGQKIYFAVFGSAYGQTKDGVTYWSMGQFVYYAGPDDFDVFKVYDVQRIGDDILALSSTDGAIVYQPQKGNVRLFIGHPYLRCCTGLMPIFDNGRAISLLIDNTFIRLHYLGDKHLHSKLVVAGKCVPLYHDMVSGKVYRADEMPEKRGTAQSCFFALEMDKGMYALYEILFSDEGLGAVYKIVGADALVRQDCFAVNPLYDAKAAERLVENLNGNRYVFARGYNDRYRLME